MDNERFPVKKRIHEAESSGAVPVEESNEVDSYVDMLALERQQVLRAALQPLASIADAYEGSALDRFRGVTLVVDPDGKPLLTLADCFQAREALLKLSEV